MAEEFSFSISKLEDYPEGVLNISSDRIQAYLIPRERLEETAKIINDLRESKSWVYCLSNQNCFDSRGQELQGYIGKTDDSFITRMKTHANSSRKDFWSQTIGFTSSNGNLTSHHSAVLEYNFYKLAKSRSRWKITNDKSPSEITPNSHDTVRVNVYKQEILRVFRILGWNLFEEKIADEEINAIADVGNILATEDLQDSNSIKSEMWKEFEKLKFKNLTNQELILLCEKHKWNKNTVRREYPAFKRANGMEVKEFRLYPVKVNGTPYSSVRAAMNELGIEGHSQQIRDKLKELNIYEIVSDGIQYRFELDE
ncbi:MAG: hypothetical protein QM523_02025 [Candidatus Pacebacteria bacterium]|nr:hypothetical protein [Candidatus Paceibacterota bacterium]